MRNSVPFLIFLFLLISPMLAKAQFDSVGIAVAKLKTYKAADLQNDIKDKDGGTLMIDQMFEDLKAGVAIGLKRPPVSPELIAQLGRVALITYAHDPTNYAAELLLPLYLKDKKQFEKAIVKFSKKDKALLLETLKDSDREFKQGNG